MLSPVQDKEQKQKLNQTRKRRTRKLFEEKRLKKRLRTTQGNICLLGSDDEEFVAKCIENKATYQ